MTYYSQSVAGPLSLFLFLFIVLGKDCDAQEPKLKFSVGHTRDIRSLEFSRDNKFLLSSGDDGSKLWELFSGKEVFDFNGHSQPVRYSRFYSRDTKVLEVLNDNRIRSWDVLKSEMINVFSGHQEKVNSLSLNKAETKLLSFSTEDSTVRIWDLKSGKQLFLIRPGNELVEAGFSPDEKQILTVSVKEGEEEETTILTVWDASTARKIKEVKRLRLRTEYFKLSPDKTKLALVQSSEEDMYLSIYDSYSGIEKLKMKWDRKPFSHRVESLVFSNDGNRLASISLDKTVRVWDLKSGKLLMLVEDSSFTPRNASFSNDGRQIFIAYAYSDKVGVWDIQKKEIMYELFPRKGGPTLAAISNNLIAYGGVDRDIKILDLRTGNLLKALGGRSEKVRLYTNVSGQRALMTMGDTSFFTFNPATGKLEKNVFGRTDDMRNSSLSSDGKRIVTISPRRGVARVWDLETGKAVADLVRSSRYYINSAVFSRDGKSVFTTSFDSTLAVWDAVSGQLLYSFKTLRTPYLTLESPDAKKLIDVGIERGGYMSYNVWDRLSGQQVSTLSTYKNIRFTGFLDSSRKISGVEAKSETFYAWDLATGNEFTSIENVTAALGETSDGLLVIAGGDGTIQLLDDKTLNVLRAANTGKKIVSLLNNPGSGRFVSVYESGEVQVWDFPTLIPGTSFQIPLGSYVAGVDLSNDLLIADIESGIGLYRLSEGKLLYKMHAFDPGTTLVMDEFGRYDGSELGKERVYLACGREAVDLEQFKELLWTPGLAERLYRGEQINARKVVELNICDLTPRVENIPSDTSVYQFKIFERKGGLGDVIVEVNGIEAKRYKLQVASPGKDTYELTIPKTELAPFFVNGWVNEVKVRALTADNNISSRGLDVREDRTKNKGAHPNLFAVFVGVSDYKAEGLDLKYAAKDAMDLSAVVGESARKLLNPDTTEHVYIYNLTTSIDRYLWPEKNSIRKVFDEIGRKANANDILMIFFAGHGVAGQGSNSDKQQFYFLTADASPTSLDNNLSEVSISTTELADWIQPERIKAQKRILVFDACNSGQAIRDFVSMGNEGQGYVSARNDDKFRQMKAIDRLNEKSGLFILSASASNQVAYELGKYSQGLLTYALLKSIKLHPDILTEGKYLDVSRWFNNTGEILADLSKQIQARQEPQVISNTNFNIGVVDEGVINSIRLPDEKPLFTSSIFLNEDESISDDDLELSKKLNGALYKENEVNSPNSVLFALESNSPDAFSLSGRYQVSGNKVLIKVNIKQNRTIKSRFEETGEINDLTSLVERIVIKAKSLVR